MTSNAPSRVRFVILAGSLLLAAGQSGCSSGGGTGNGSGGSGGSGTTTAGGKTGTTGGTAGAGMSGGGGAGGVGAGGTTGSAGASGGAGAGGRNGSGGAAGGAGPAGGAAAGGQTGTAGLGGTGTAGSPGGTGGIGAGGTTGPLGSGGQGAGGQTGAGGSTVTCTGAAPTGTTFTVDTTGVTFTVGSGKMKVQVCAADIIRVVYTSASSIPTTTSMSVSNTWATPPAFCVTEAAGTLTITTARMKVKVTESTGIVSYTDLSDTALVAESSKSASGKVQTAFTSTSDEALFGLGQQPSTTSNRKNSSVHLANSNGNIFIPMIVSNKGYGLFWDNPSAGDFSSNGTTTSYTSGSGAVVDYYFFYGPTIDQVIAGYRTTTGPAPLFPKWAYGLFQSKDHYASQSQILAVKDGYRNAKIPVDCIVQDWDYWNENNSATGNSWGSHLFDKSAYPEPGVGDKWFSYGQHPWNDLDLA